MSGILPGCLDSWVVAVGFCGEGAYPVGLRSSRNPDDRVSLLEYDCRFWGRSQPNGMKPRHKVYLIS